MAIYKRKTVAKRKTYRKKTGIARKAYNMVRRIKRTYKPELKKKDTGQVTADADTTATLAPIHLVAQGDDYNNREGNKILGRYISAKGWVQHNNTATVGQVVKVWVIQDKQQIGDTTPTAADIFTTAAASVTSPMNPKSGNRFRILWSKTYTVDPGNEIRPLYLNKRISIPTYFNGTANSDIQKNGLYLMWASSDTTNKPTLTYDLRYSFYDN